MDITNLLNACEQTQSTITRTGVFYKYNNRIVLEYMKSTRNVWIDDEIASIIPKEDKPDVEKQIRTFFQDRVNNITFGFELNKSVDDFNQSLNDILNNAKTLTNENRLAMENIINAFKK